MSGKKDKPFQKAHLNSVFLALGKRKATKRALHKIKRCNVSYSLRGIL